MKLYQNRTTGFYYEKQDEAHREAGRRNTETVEFPFAASPKGDFVAWLNAQAFEQSLKGGWTAEEQAATEALLDLPPVVAKPVGPCASTAPSPAKDDLAFRREVSERWDSLPLTYRLDLGMLAFEDARNVVRS